MEPLSKAATNAKALAYCIAIIIAAMLFLGPIARVAQAAPAAIDSSGTSATIPAPTSTKYSEDKTGKTLWNHGSFYVYFFQGTKSVKTSLAKTSGSDTSTLTTKVGFEDGVSWAKVDIAAVSSSAAGNGGKIEQNGDEHHRHTVFSIGENVFLRHVDTSPFRDIKIISYQYPIVNAKFTPASCCKGAIVLY